MAPKINPFGQEHCECFTNAAKRGMDLDELLGCLQECGIDMAPIKAQNDETVKIATDLKAKFFPGEP